MVTSPDCRHAGHYAPTAGAALVSFSDYLPALSFPTRKPSKLKAEPMSGSGIHRGR